MVEPVAGCRARRSEACRNKENDLCELAGCARKQESRLGAWKIFSIRSGVLNRKFRAHFRATFREERLPTARFAAR